MKRTLIPTLAALAILPFVGSCASLNSHIPVPASFDSPAKASRSLDEESWASRHIPGVRQISKLLPEPSDARIKWDKWYNRKNNHSISSSANDIR
jgi:hypothetical protein